MQAFRKAVRNEGGSKQAYLITDTEPNTEKWLTLNTEYAAKWPNITRKKDSPADAKEWDGKPNKLELLSTEPGAGD